MLYPKEYVDLINSLLPEYYEKDSNVFSNISFKLYRIGGGTNSCAITYKNYFSVIEKDEILKIAKNRYSEIIFNDHVFFNSNNGLIKYYRNGHISEFPTNFFEWTEEDFFIIN